MKKKSSTEPVYGNYVDKYHTSNRIEKLLMSDFLNHFRKLLSQTGLNNPERICEVGCGDGELLKVIRTVYPSQQISACDISPEQVEMAAGRKENDKVQFSVQNAESLSGYDDQSFDIVICVEVLEHLERPERGLDELVRISRDAMLISVPNEPIWRMLNIARGKYWNALGNTPGHLNHWSPFQFPAFLAQEQEFKITKKTYPFPWQMILLNRVKTVEKDRVSEQNESYYTNTVL